jgi:hypothetical protein
MFPVTRVFFAALLVVWSVMIAEALGFTVFFKTDGDALGRHKILLAIPEDPAIPASDINAGISAAQYDGSTHEGQDVFTCVHEWTNKRGTGRYYVADDGALMERSDFTMPPGSLASLSPLCINDGYMLTPPVMIITGTTP